MPKIKIVAIGDLHFGNPRINSEIMYNHLKSYLYPELEDAQVLLITGDTYDQLTTVTSSANRYALKFIKDIFLISAATGLQVRILHGTYSHDRDQISIFENLKVKHAKYKIINELSGDVLSDFNNGATEQLKILYIPDNLQFKTSEEVVTQIKKLYQCYHWKTADLVLGHGTFMHALPVSSEHAPACTYTIEQFKPLVSTDGIVIMGHIHTPSHRANVYYCGSFERMAHNEEEAKGFYTFTRDFGQSSTWEAKFIKNSDTTLFKTITPQGDTPEKLVKDFIRQVKETFQGKPGYVRAVYTEPEMRGIYQRICASQFSGLIFSGKNTAEEKDNGIKLEDITLDVFTDVAPNVNNLGELVYQYLDTNNKLDNLPKDIIIDYVNKMIQL